MATTDTTLSEVRKCMEQARVFLSRQRGAWTPEKRRTWTYEHGDMTIELHGESLGQGPVATYRGPLGTFAANINPKSIGKPWATDFR